MRLSPASVIEGHTSLAPRSIGQENLELVAAVGSDVTLSCDVEGSTPMTYKWVSWLLLTILSCSQNKYMRNLFSIKNNYI